MLGNVNRMGNPEYARHASSGSLNIPPGALNGTNGQSQMGPGHQFGVGPRSPPPAGKQNTSHVPCKFHRQGACQAGPSCPFNHNLDNTADSVCKYFAKGNCKFGPKCANAHILPNGQRVNYKGPLMGDRLNFGGRINTDFTHGRGSGLTNSFAHHANGVGGTHSPYTPQSYTPFGNGPDVDYPSSAHLSHPNYDSGLPVIEASFASNTGSNYGSPREEDRMVYGLSPAAQKAPSALDAPLPASFDSNGISRIAKYGPLGSSVPTKFGLDSSPPSSVGTAGRGSEALKNLHSSAFGDDTRDRFNGTAGSPPSEPEYFGRRAMHSNRASKSKFMSTSLPPADQDWNAEFTFEETDYLPEALSDLMTPQEKARRGSRNADEEGRPILYSGAGTPINTGTPINENGTKWGSPSNASPSRWGPLFQQRNQQQKEEEEKSAASRASAFGHVGSPLRNSTLHPGASPSSRPIARPSLSGDSSPYMASPPRQSSMSIISQQLQRTRLSRAESSGSDSPAPSGLRPTSNPMGSGPARQVSSSSIGGSGRFTTPIDEEQGDFVFSMEEDEAKSEKRSSGGWGAYGVKPSSQGGSKPNSNGVEGMFGTR